jgi:ABC-type lipoprotein release transport system permease subunit
VFLTRTTALARRLYGLNRLLWMRHSRYHATMQFVIGVSAVIILAAAGQGFKTFVLDQFSAFGASKVWIFPRMPPEQRDRFSFRQIRLNTDQVDSILSYCPSLQAITPVMQINATVQAGDRVQQFVNIQGVRPSWHDIEERSVIRGRALMQVDEDERRQVCLVNDKAIEELGLDADPTGTTILAAERRFLIIGVVETITCSSSSGILSRMRRDRFLASTASVLPPPLVMSTKGIRARCRNSTASGAPSMMRTSARREQRS